MSQKKDIIASDATGQGGLSCRADSSPARSLLTKQIELLNEREFRERFSIPNGVSVQLVEGGTSSTKKAGDNAMYFTKEQFNVGLHLPLPSLFKQFLHYTRISLALLDLNVILVLMGCNTLDMLFHLDLSLLEVLFVYTIKKGKNDIFNLSASIPSVQLVIGLPNSIKRAAKGHVLVKGPWAGLMEHRKKEFVPNQSMRVLGGNAFSSTIV